MSDEQHDDVLSLVSMDGSPILDVEWYGSNDGKNWVMFAIGNHIVIPKNFKKKYIVPKRSNQKIAEI